MSPPLLSGDFTLWTTPEKFFLTSEDSPAKILIVDRATTQIYVETYRHQIQAVVGRRAISGLIGVINISSGPHLVVGVSRQRVGLLTRHNHMVWRLDGVDVLPFKHSSNDQDGAEKRKMVVDMFSTPSFYFSLTLDITNCQQKLDALVENDAKGYCVLSSASRTFTWNYQLLLNGGLALNKDFHPWCLALVFGSISINECSLNGKLFRWSILSRRSSKMAGTRFFRRGCDNLGNVANFVETEQLVEHQETMTSFVQIRGSIPLYWNQLPTLAYLPRPKIVENVDHQAAFNVHMERLLHNYGSQVLVNLVNHKKPEGILEEKMRFLHKSAASHLANHIDYEAFDFHANCSSLRWDRLSQLLDKLHTRLDNFGYFLQQRGFVNSLQTGTMRTNCMDCLDRTNVVQSIIARENLTKVLRHVGILNEGDVIHRSSDFYKLFRNVWADHANVIACQYAGSGALKTDFTRTGRRTLTGMLKDGKIALARYIANNFSDGYKQDTIDLVLGNIGHFSLEDRKKNWTFYAPVGLVVAFSLLLLTTLLAPEADMEFHLLTICFLSGAIFCGLTVLRHSQSFVDTPRLLPAGLQSTRFHEKISPIHEGITMC